MRPILGTQYFCMSLTFLERALLISYSLLLLGFNFINDVMNAK